MSYFLFTFFMIKSCHYPEVMKPGNLIRYEVYMKIFNVSRETILAENCNIANNFLSRFRGLMGVRMLPAGSGLHIVPCNSIHMFFMKIPLDIVFMDGNNVVVYMVEDIKPWKVSKIVNKAHSVLELPHGTINASGTCVGDKIEFNTSPHATLSRHPHCCRHNMPS